MKTIHIIIMLVLLCTFGFLINTVSAEEVEKSEIEETTSKLSFFDKGRLNDPIMQIDFGPNRARLDQHIYQVREGSIGGYDKVGGNCGCN